MGAFDGLNFYQSCIKSGQIVKEYSKPLDTFYISYDGSNGGLTGKHFDNRKDAIHFFMRKWDKGKHPAPWFDAPELKKYNRNNCECERCIRFSLLKNKKQ